MDESFLRDDRVARVQRVKAVHILFCHAVGQVVVFAETAVGLALPDGKALRSPLFADGRHHIHRLGAEIPVGIAEVEEGRAVAVSQVFFAVTGGDEAVLIDGKVAAVSRAVYLRRPAVQRFVRFVGTDGPALPRSRLGADEAYAPCIAAVPEAGNGVKSSAAPKQQVQRHVLKGIGVGLFAFKAELDRPPRLGGEAFLRRAGKQRGIAFLPRGVTHRRFFDAGFVGEGDDLQHPPQQAAERADCFFQLQHGVRRSASRVRANGGRAGRKRAEKQYHRKKQSDRSFHSESSRTDKSFFTGFFHAAIRK